MTGKEKVQMDANFLVQTFFSVLLIPVAQ
jgi:hypothetical protein